MFFNTGRSDEAKYLVKTYHYSHRWPMTPNLVATAHSPGGLFGDMGEVIAACIFSEPSARMWSGPVWELTRLVRTDERIPLTPLIAFACKQAKKKGAHLLISYADWTQGHHGGIYQAASWKFHGMRPAKFDGYMIGGTFMPSRSANALYGSAAIDHVKACNPGVEVTRNIDAGKYLYYRALTKEGKRRAKKLELEDNPYPKPDNVAEKSA